MQEVAEFSLVDIGPNLKTYVLKFLNKNCWEATGSGGLQTGGFQTGHCNIEKSALYFSWKRVVSSLSKPKRIKKRALF